MRDKSFTVTGTLETIGAVLQVSENFKKRKFVVLDNSNPQYPEHFELELTQEKTVLTDAFNIGDKVKIHANVRGRKWIAPDGNEVYLSEFNVWNISPVRPSTI